MMSIHTFKQVIQLYPAHIITVNILSAEHIHYDYNDIVAKPLIAGNI